MLQTVHVSTPGLPLDRAAPGGARRTDAGDGPDTDPFASLVDDSLRASDRPEAPRTGAKAGSRAVRDDADDPAPPADRGDDAADDAPQAAVAVPLWVAPQAPTAAPAVVGLGVPEPCVAADVAVPLGAEGADADGVGEAAPSMAPAAAPVTTPAAAAVPMPEPSPAEAPALEATAASVVPGPATEHAAAPGRPGDDGAPVAPVGDRPAPAPALRDAQSEATTEDAQPMRRDPRPPEQSAAQGPHDVRPEQARQLDARGARITAEAADSPEPEVAPAPQGAQRPPVRATGSVRPAIVPEAASGAAASGPSPAVAAVQIGGARAGESSGAEAGGSRDGVPGAIRPSLTPGVAVSAAPMLLHGEFARQLATVAQAAAHRASVSAGEELAPQIVQALRMQVLQGGGEARVQLRPEHLGALTIDVRVENGRVSATFNAEVPAVRHWLESHESSLRQALSEQGLELSRFVVHEDGEAPSQEQQGQGESRRRQARRTRQGEEDATFEVIV